MGALSGSGRCARESSPMSGSTHAASISDRQPSLHEPGGDHGRPQILESVDMALHHIACLDRPNPFGRAGKDQVPRAQSDEAREVLDDLRDTPDQMSDITLLAYFTVHLEPDRASLQITTHRGRNEGRARRGFIKALPHVPRPALLARVHLQVSACHIEAYGIAENVPVRLFGCN